MSKVVIDNQQAKAITLRQNSKTGIAHSRADEIQQWLTAYVANLLEMAYEDVDATISFADYGLDSAAAVGMTGELETWLGQDVDPTLPYIYPTIETLAQHLATDVDIKAYSKEAL